VRGVIRDEERMIYDMMGIYYEQTERLVIYDEQTERLVTHEEQTERLVTHEEQTERLVTHEEQFALTEKEKKKQKVPSMD
jgi:hypothetical protein